jgi:hypothetical protein
LRQLDGGSTRFERTWWQQDNVDVVIVPMVAASRARRVQAGGGAYQWVRGRARWCRRLLEGRHKVVRLYSVRQSVGGQVQGGAGQERAGRTRCVGEQASVSVGYVVMA